MTVCRGSHASEIRRAAMNIRCRSPLDHAPVLVEEGMCDNLKKL
jgi:hypothetical protein